VVESGAKVIVEVPTPLKSLLAQISGVSRLVAKGEALPPFDLQCPLMSLPLAFGTTLATIPAKVPYLVAPTTRVAQWRHRLGDAQIPRVGVVWAGNQQHNNDRNRSIPLQEFCTFRSSRFQFVSLQKELRPNDQGTLQACEDILHFGDELRDFEDTAA
jgi:hypothetical protein